MLQGSRICLRRECNTEKSEYEKGFIPEGGGGGEPVPWIEGLDSVILTEWIKVTYLHQLCAVISVSYSVQITNTLDILFRLTLVVRHAQQLLISFAKNLTRP